MPNNVTNELLKKYETGLDKNPTYQTTLSLREVPQSKPPIESPINDDVLNQLRKTHDAKHNYALHHDSRIPSEVVQSTCPNKKYPCPFLVVFVVFQKKVF